MRGFLAACVLTVGCTYPEPDCADGYDRDAKGVCQGGSADTGVETVDTGDTAQEGPASLTGPIDIGILAETGGLVLEDVCTGTVGLSVEGEVVDGTLSCVFQGTVAGIIGEDPFTGTVSGQIAEDGTASGPLDMELGAFGALAATWLGTASTEAVDATFGADTIIVVGALEVPVTYEGSFSAR